MTNKSANPYFKGKIDGKTVKDLSKLNMKKTSLEDRREEVDNILNSSDFYMDFFDNYYKSDINASNSLSENLNVSQNLEKYANYLLSSDECIAEDKANKPIYVFHKSTEKFNKKMERENVTVKHSGAPMGVNLTEDENMVHVLKANKKNSRVPKIQKITKKDLQEDSLCGEILRDYQIFLDFIDKKLKETPDKNWRFYSNNKFSVKQDMVDVKNMVKGVWGYNSFISESSTIDNDIFDFTDSKTVKFLLSMSKPDFTSNFDMWLNWKEFMETVMKANLTKEELFIVNCLQNQWKTGEIAESLNVEYMPIYMTSIPRIVKKITKVGNKYDAEIPEINEKLKKMRLKNIKNKTQKEKK